MTALKLIGDLFHSYHDLFLWLIVLGGDKFKKRVKKVYFLIEAMPSSMRDRLGDHEVTKQILELHGFGQSLVTIDCAKIVPDVSNLHVDWDNTVQLPETRLREWEDSLRCVMAGLRYAR